MKKPLLAALLAAGLLSVLLCLLLAGTWISAVFFEKEVSIPVSRSSTRSEPGRPFFAVEIEPLPDETSAGGEEDAFFLELVNAATGEAMETARVKLSGTGRDGHAFPS
jgi:hypothetical protein